MSAIVKNYVIQAPAGTTIVERMVMPAHVAASVDVYAAEHATIRLLVESEGAIAGSLSLTTHTERGARIFVGVCVRVAGTDSFAITTTQRHETPHGTSKLWVRKIVSNEAMATYQGTIHIAHEAIGTVVAQDDKSLLDGLRARAESTPVLEVLTNEVICTHGSALGRVDPQMVWYIETRGFSPSEARELWYAAFFEEICQKVLSEG